ncbi:MAG: SufD family Fe-S cluster assembly protein [Candidatus Shikimatogenerans sp. Tser]|uniref:SufD family Fe-S cluster assembly protein n=1 Tax=Candidatus Shikimatogenerans sp. Tser TaxID=3158568 RepID=A0AAU7QQS0_9FLAO
MAIILKKFYKIINNNKKYYNFLYKKNIYKFYFINNNFINFISQYDKKKIYIKKKNKKKYILYIKRKIKNDIYFLYINTYNYIININIYIKIPKYLKINIYEKFLYTNNIVLYKIFYIIKCLKKSKLNFYKENINYNKIYIKYNFIFKLFTCSKCNFYLLNINNIYIKYKILIFLKEKKSKFKIYCLSLLKKNNYLKIKSIIHHKNNKTYSKQIFKNINLNYSKLYLFNKINIKKKIKNIYSIQKVKNFNISNNINVVIKPYLDINSNNIKCYHGVINNKIDNNLIYYFKIRGIYNTYIKKILILIFLKNFLFFIKKKNIYTIINNIYE